MLIETHHLIEMMKRYHESLRRTYSIITIEIFKIDSELALQMTFKVINDSIELNNLISILLVFEIYFRMIEMNTSSSIITQRAIVMKKIMKEVRKLNAMRQVNDVLNTRSESSITLIHDLSSNSFVLIFKENNIDQSDSWKEFFKLLNIQNESAIIELSNESTKLRSTSVKSYYQNNHTDDENSSSSSILSFSVFTSNMSSFIESQNDFIIDSTLSQSSNTISLIESQNNFIFDSIVRTLIH